MIVNLNKLRRVKEYLLAINDCDLENILWLESNGLDAAVIKQATKEQIEEWKFIGLANKDFPEFVGWGVW